MLRFRKHIYLTRRAEKSSLGFGEKGYSVRCQARFSTTSEDDFSALVVTLESFNFELGQVDKYLLLTSK